MGVSWFVAVVWFALSQEVKMIVEGGGWGGGGGGGGGGGVGGRAWGECSRLR